MGVRNKTESDASWIRELLVRHFGSERLVSRGVLHDGLILPGLVAVGDDSPAGFLLYKIVEGECEVVAVIADQTRIGAGRYLLKEIEKFAAAGGCKRLWLITTNENATAIQFYTSMGWEKVAIHKGAVREARKLKPEIPEAALDGTPIEDELEFEFPLSRFDR